MKWRQAVVFPVPTRLPCQVPVGRPQDLRDTVSFAKRNGWSVLAVIGHSRGANGPSVVLLGRLHWVLTFVIFPVVLLYGVKYGDVPGVVSISGRFDMSQLPRKYFTAEQVDLLSRPGGISEFRHAGNQQQCKRFGMGGPVWLEGRGLSRQNCTSHTRGLLGALSSGHVRSCSHGAHHRSFSCARHV